MNRVKSPITIKGIMAAAGAAVMALQPYYGSQHWFTAVVGALAALGVVVSENHIGGTGSGS